ncbi:MAG: hypothetical protein KIT83_05295 [Bryobacterales bacterium]|nr:hypothetical protein [Bryobacterales bacterium]
MNTSLRVMFWVMTAATCFGVIFCAYQIESPLAVRWPVEEIAIWGSLAALFFAVGLFFVMPQSPNGRKGLLIAFGLAGFTVWTSFQTLQQTRFLYRRLDLAVTIETDNQETQEVTSMVVGGTLFLPVNRYELPVALLMPDGSEDAFARNVFVAKALARRGVAAVAYGRSAVTEPGLLSPVDLTSRGEDVIYVLDLLEKVNEIYMRRAGVVGFYENEWVVPFTLQKTNRLNYGVLLAPTGISPEERAVAFLDRELRSEGFGAEQVEVARGLVRDLAENLRTGDIGSARSDLILRWDAAAKEPWFAAAGFPAEPPQAGTTGAVAATMGFDAAALWKDARVPIRIVAGSEDPQSLPETLRERFTQYFESNERGDWTLDVVSGANHRMLLGADTYSTDATWPPGFFDNLANWITETTRPQEAGADR